VTGTRTTTPTGTPIQISSNLRRGFV
jgi:hypothetical protein